MNEPARRLATYEDVLAAPEHMVAEVLAGELFLHPRPAKPHAAAASALGEELGPPFKREVLRLIDGNWTNVGVYADEQEVRAEPFEAIVLELGVLWADVRL